MLCCPAGAEAFTPYPSRNASVVGGGGGAWGTAPGPTEAMRQEQEQEQEQQQQQQQQQQVVDQGLEEQQAGSGGARRKRADTLWFMQQFQALQVRSGWEGGWGVTDQDATFSNTVALWLLPSVWRAGWSACIGDKSVWALEQTEPP